MLQWNYIIYTPMGLYRIQLLLDDLIIAIDMSMWAHLNWHRMQQHALPVYIAIYTHLYFFYAHFSSTTNNSNSTTPSVSLRVSRYDRWSWQGICWPFWWWGLSCHPHPWWVPLWKFHSFFRLRKWTINQELNWQSWHRFCSISFNNISEYTYNQRLYSHQGINQTACMVYNRISTFVWNWFNLTGL